MYIFDIFAFLLFSPFFKFLLNPIFLQLCRHFFWILNFINKSEVLNYKSLKNQIKCAGCIFGQGE